MKGPQKTRLDFGTYTKTSVKITTSSFESSFSSDNECCIASLRCIIHRCAARALRTTADHDGGCA